MNNNNNVAVKATKDITLTTEEKKDLHAHQIDLLNCIKVTGACGTYTSGGDCPKDREASIQA